MFGGPGVNGQKSAKKQKSQQSFSDKRYKHLYDPKFLRSWFCTGLESGTNRTVGYVSVLGAQDLTFRSVALTPLDFQVSKQWNSSCNGSTFVWL